MVYINVYIYIYKSYIKKTSTHTHTTHPHYTNTLFICIYHPIIIQLQQL